MNVWELLFGGGNPEKFSHPTLIMKFEGFCTGHFGRMKAIKQHFTDNMTTQEFFSGQR